MPNKDQHRFRQELRAAAWRRLSRLKIAALTVSTLVFGGLTASLASQVTLVRSVASSTVASTPAATSAATPASPTANAAPAAPAAAAPAAAASKASVSQPIVSAQS